MKHQIWVILILASVAAESCFNADLNYAGI
jgi:hypothetical protein